MHKVVEPAIHYWGTPVVLISTLNENKSANLAPMSSAWWLGWSCMLGLDASSKTTENLKRTGQCVLNLASVDIVNAVDRLAMLTGSASVPLHKKLLGYRYTADKFGAAGLTPEPSMDIAPPRVKECLVQLEAVVENIWPFAVNDPRMAVPAYAIEVRILRTYIEESILRETDSHRIDPDKWCPLIMSFRNFYGLSDNVHTSRLGLGPEDAYAPWKFKGLKGVVSKVLGQWARYKYQK
ncbi:MAG: flavin reductase family protein [Acidobacteriota bacterium]